MSNPLAIPLEPQPSSPPSRVAHRSAPVDGFQLAYDRRGSGPTVIALHGWPSDRHDWRPVADQLASNVDFITPDLRGFGESDAHARDPARAYTAAAQAASILGLIDELGLDSVVLAGYDLGSMVADRLVRVRPGIVRGLVLAPPLPGLAKHLGEPPSLRERWYISFHQSQLAGDLIDGDRDAVRAYLAYFWSRWSGPSFQLDGQELERLTGRYAEPGAFTASISVYRSGRPEADGTPLSVPTTLLWPDSDPLFPADWAADAHDSFTMADLQVLPRTGHFVAREAPERFAAAILDHAGRWAASRH